MRSIVAAAGGAPAVSTRTPRAVTRTSSGALAMAISTVGAAHSMVIRSAFDEPVDRRGVDLAQADVRRAHRGDDPRERPAVGVEHRQRPQVAIGRSHRHVNERADAFTQALRCVIITPFGREVVPLV